MVSGLVSPISSVGSSRARIASPELQAPGRTVAEPPSPRRARRCDLLACRRAHRDQLEPDRPPRGRHPRLLGGAEGVDALDPVRREDRREDYDPTGGRHDRGDASQDRQVEAHDAAQQRAPRERDRHERGDSGQRSGQRLGRLDEEARVRHAMGGTSTIGSPGRLGHRGRIGVDADRQGARLSGRPRKDGSAVAGPEIDDHPVGPGDPFVELADVDVADAPADHLSHGRESIGCSHCQQSAPCRSCGRPLLPG